MDPDPRAGTVATALTGAGSPVAGRRVPRAGRARHRAARPEPLTLLWCTWAPGLFAFLGVLARLRQWAGGRSLWLDEVLTADSIVHRGFWELATRPLLHREAAPLLWVESERLAVDVFGAGERSLRLVPLLSGLAALGLAWLLARRLLPATLVPVAVLLVALNPALVYFANEVKQYSTDVAVVLAIVLLALAVRTGHERALRRLAAFGALAVWLSYAAVLALAGVSVLLVLRPLLAGQRRSAARVAALISPWLLSLALAYLLVLRPLRSNEVLAAYWAYSYPGSAADLPAWAVRCWLDLAHIPLHLTFAALGLALLALGLLRLARYAGSRAWLACSPVPFAMLAGALSVYPFADRLALWLVPLAAVVLAAVLPHRAGGGWLPWLLVTSAALTVAMGPAVWAGLQLTHRVQTVEEIRPLLAQLAAARRPGDLVYVDIAAAAPFDYYRTQVGVHRDGVILLTPRIPPASCHDALALRTGQFASHRVWVVFGHQLVDTARLGSTADLLAQIETASRQVERLTSPGAAAYLFDPVAGAGEASAVPANANVCLRVVRSRR